MAGDWLRYELSDDTSSKFWEIRQDGSAYVVRYGRIGSTGREQRKELDSPGACAAMLQKKIEEKKKKGYESTGPAASALWVAVAARDEDAVRAALADGADPNESHDGQCVLELSLGKRCDANALALIEAGAELSALSTDALNPVWATLTERVDVVRAFLDAGAPVDYKAIMGTPLRIAAGKGLVEILSLLITRGADLELGGVTDTPLTDAIENGEAECARLLVAAGASCDPERNHRRSPLAHAAIAGMDTLVAAMIEAGADLEARDTFHSVDEAGIGDSVNAMLEGVADALEQGGGDVISLGLGHHVSVRYQGATPLIVAAGEGHEACVRLLVEAGAELDAIDERGSSAVAHARAKGKTATAERLVRAGADPAAEATPAARLILAAEQGELAEVERALAEGAPVDAPDDRDEQLGRTALMLAAARGHLPCVDELLGAGADVNRSDDHGEENPVKPGAFWMRDDSRGRNALMLAAEAGHTEAVQRLLGAGAETGHADRTKENALVLAASGGHVECVRALLDAGADPNQRGADRRNALRASLENGGEAAAPLLIEAGTKLDVKDGGGETVLHLSALMGFETITRKLLDAGANPTIKNREGARPHALADDAPHERLLKDAAARWAAEGSSEPEPVDEELERANAARARTPEVDVPDVAELSRRYERDAVVERLQEAAEGEGFRAALDEIVERLDAVPEDQRASLGGHLLRVATSRLDLDALAALQQEMLPRGVYVFSTSRASSTREPCVLLVLPTSDRYEAVAVLGTTGGEDEWTNGHILRWLMHRQAFQPFHLLHIDGDLLDGVFETEIADPEELAQSMFDLCPDIADEGSEEIAMLADELVRSRRLYFWWD